MRKKKAIQITLMPDVVALLDKMAADNQRRRSEQIAYLILREAANVNGARYEEDGTTAAGARYEAAVGLR